MKAFVFVVQSISCRSFLLPTPIMQAPRVFEDLSGKPTHVERFFCSKCSHLWVTFSGAQLLSMINTLAWFLTQSGDEKKQCNARPSTSNSEATDDRRLQIPVEFPQQTLLIRLTSERKPNFADYCFSSSPSAVVEQSDPIFLAKKKCQTRMALASDSILELPLSLVLKMGGLKKLR